MRDGGVDRIFRDVALGARIVVARAVALEGATLALHLVRRLPGADDDLADPAHGLGIARHHREGAQIMENVFGRDRLLADAAFGEGEILGNALVEVMADHQHVEMFVERVLRIGPRRVGG